MLVITATDTGITVTGHAGHGPPGQDIVCAAVSALTYTLAAALERLTEDQVSSALQNGDAEVRVERPSPEARLLLAAYRLGVAAIAEAYPDHVKIVTGGQLWKR